MTLLAVGAGALLWLTAYLAAVETVVSRTPVVMALRLVEEGDHRGAPALLWLTEHRASALNVLMVVTVTSRVALAAVATVAGQQVLGTPLGVVAAVAVVVAASLVLAEAVPRTVVLRHLEAVGLRVAGSARVLVRAGDPLAHVVVGLGRALVPRRHEVSGPYADDEEVGLGEPAEEEDDELEPEERAMLRSVLELADTSAREVMVPRPDMVTVAADAPFEAAVAVAIEHGVSRLPVLDPDDDELVVGVLYAKDLLARLARDPQPERWDDLLRPPTYVPETTPADELLRELQASRVHLALVADEHGALVGLITIEDILEEIVGEIVDEHDQEDPLVEPLDDGRLRIDARLGVDDLNELLGSQLPEEGWDTVGGLVFGTLGRVPSAGQTLELDGYVITVERVQGRRVAAVVVAPAVDGAALPGAADG